MGMQDPSAKDPKNEEVKSATQKTVIVDPVTRIEGHMKVEVTIENNQVVDARCTGTLFRGFEAILQGRDPRDAPVLTERICGVCPVSHGMASVMALESAAGGGPPTDALMLRNLVLGANFIQSHILHFYLLAAFDYNRGPASAPWTPAWNIDLDRGWDVSGSLSAAIEARRRAHEMGSVFGGRMPAPHTYIPGGFTAVPAVERINQFRDHLSALTAFISNIYIKDVEALADHYSEYGSEYGSEPIGEGCGNLLAYGVFDLDVSGANKLFKGGTVEAGKASIGVDTSSITESVACSWYDDSTTSLNPVAGVTAPVYPKSGAYSWLKAPRYAGMPFEVGPLARMWVSGLYQPGRVSVMARHLARAYEAQRLAEAMDEWLNRLTPGSNVYNDFKTPTIGQGVGLTEAPRGALGHWVEIGKEKISNYQIITPTCWNASPLDDHQQHGPMEQALLGTPVEDPAQPIEIMRVIHSFDPCLSCAVHVMRPSGEPVIVRSGSKL
jgi:hydrogenase large subunit